MLEPKENVEGNRLASLALSLESLAESARRAISLIEDRLAPALERIADATDRGGPGLPTPRSGPSSTSPAESIRLAIREGRWIEAEGLLRELDENDPRSGEVGAFSREIALGKAAAIESGRARLAAAQSVFDPKLVIEARDGLAGLLPAADRSSLDREVVKGLMAVLQKRLRSGKIGVEVAELAALMADRFAETTEGASLRAALPTLRRSAGLCPRCASPYKGIEDACPKCLGRPEPADEGEVQE